VGSRAASSTVRAAATSSVTWFAVGDIGVACRELSATARAMDVYARGTAAPDLVLLLGDNFYPGKRGRNACVPANYVTLFPAATS
jgi:hypothetical protein